MNKYLVLTFYKYVEISDPEKLKEELLSFCSQNNIKGKTYLAYEGINSSVSGRTEDIQKYKEFLNTYIIFNDLVYKEDVSDFIAYNKLFVRVREELVNSGYPNISLDKSGRKLKPEELVNLYKSNEDFVIIDTRNWYESKIGKFKDAVSVPIKNFREWTDAVDSLHEYKDKKVITYCTGGIRCEKASAVLTEKGFKNVFQLDGGIVSFVKKYPDTYWEGSVFVFDERRIVEPNTKEELKHIATCHFCNKPSSYHINCHNLECDKLIVSCHACKIENEYCCSEECRTAVNKRKKFYG